MTEAEAMDRLIMLTDATSEPVLAPADLELLLSISKRVDRFRILPGDPSWEATYDLNYAAAQGWLVKSGKLASRYNFMTGGKMFSRQQFYDHCMKMYYKYSGKSPLKSIRLGTHRYDSILPVPSNLD